MLCSTLSLSYHCANLSLLCMPLSIQLGNLEWNELFRGQRFLAVSSPAYFLSVSFLLINTAMFMSAGRPSDNVVTCIRAAITSQTSIYETMVWHRLLLIPFWCFQVLPTKLCCITADQRYTHKLLSKFSSSMVQFSSKSITTDQCSISKLSSIVTSKS